VGTFFIAVLTVTPAEAAPSVYDQISPNVGAANARVGQPDNVISPAYRLVEVARGSDALENPSGAITRYGFLNDSPPQPIEPSKTEPDEHTYLHLDHNPGGPTAGYDYGRNFVYQGHENGADIAYITRVNLDVADSAHHITLLTPVGQDGKTSLNRIDGSVWDPFTRTLLFTQENGNQGGVVQTSADWPGTVQHLDGIVGRAGYEGIHPDNRGNLFMVEDVGGARVNVIPTDPTSPVQAAQPNSFVYRFVPTDVADLSKGGKLQALQVSMNGQPLAFNAANPLGDTHSTAQLNLHTSGSSFPVKWVTVHDTAVDGFQPYDANALAKAALATPFKRPENGAFQPGTNFKTFFFVATGDTNALSGGQAQLAARGAWGAIFRLDFDADGNTGKISLFALGDATHSSFDNLTFADGRTLLVTEDRGDGLHRQLNLLDSVWPMMHWIQTPLRAVSWPWEGTPYRVSMPGFWMPAQPVFKTTVIMNRQAWWYPRVEVNQYAVGRILQLLRCSLVYYTTTWSKQPV